jgi:hypothetical protein
MAPFSKAVKDTVLERSNVAFSCLARLRPPSPGTLP